MTRQRYFDIHNHSTFSHDAVCAMESLCAAVAEKGLDGIAFTDHGDVQDYKRESDFDHIRASVTEARRLGAVFAPDLAVLSGVELGEAVWDPKKAAEFVKATDLDVVLGSVHSVRYKDIWESFSRIDFSGWSLSELDGYMRQYFEDMEETVWRVDYDVLTHLSNPLKYINGKYGRGISLEPYMPRIEQILKCAADKGLALEINTALKGTAYDVTMPEGEIIRLYKSLGGRYLSIGSDAHVEHRGANCLDFALRLAKDAGFDRYVYFVNRERQEEPILL
ncbi:MAG: histidinol-phosphatase HisJ family protein [Clostridia bacterium]|nr:histidinol-phosphatase HisJ family protein [Clostridia bacterium]